MLTHMELVIRGCVYSKEEEIKVIHDSIHPILKKRLSKEALMPRQKPLSGSFTEKGSNSRLGGVS